MSATRPPGPVPAATAGARRRTVSTVAIGGGVAVLGADVLAVVRPPADAVCAGLALVTAVAALVLAAARIRRRSDEHGPWLLVAAGIGFGAAGTTLTSLATGGVAAGADVLHVADLLWLGPYASWYVATMLLARRYLGGAHRSFWLDGVLVGLAAGAYTSAVFLEDLVATSAGGFDAAVLLARPSADLALLALSAGMLLMIGRLSPQGALLCAGLGVVLAGDILRLGDLSAGTSPGPDVPIITALGLLMLAGVGWSRPAPGRMLPVGGWWELTTPAALMTLVCAIFVVDHVHRLPTAAVVLASATFLAALARMVATLREVRSLALHRREALTDDLTRLPNRRALFRELEVLTAPGARSSRRLALLQLDLDGFKELNDTLGHQAGDDLLVAVSRRLEVVVPGTLARLGGDEFAAIVGEGHDARAVAEAIGEALQEPLDIEGVGISVRASVGIAHFPDDAHDARELARRADVAMYDAKRLGTVVAGYQAERDEHSRDRLSLAADLRRALESDELWLAFQPQVEIATGRITGAEALIRWRHPEQGEIPPGVLLPVAERTGLMRQLTLWVLEHAVAQAAEWRRHDLPMRVAVNVSAIVLVDATLPDRITSILSRHSLTPDNLVVEVTEDAVMSDTKRAIAILDRIKASGVEIAIDDFGTGHSSLEQLKNVPADELKLDRSFVLGMHEDPHDAAIVGSVIGLGKAMGLRIVAEGVETAPVWTELAMLRCDIAQGFGLARPMPAAQFERWARQPPDVARRLVPSLHTSRTLWRGRAA